MPRIPPPKPRPYRLRNKIQHYAWGTRGGAAFIPRLLGVEAEANRPYAELWMGAHDKAPSEVMVDGSYVSLRELIAQYPLEILGETVSEAFSGTMPFLFKVLSAAEALSIQAHPNKEQAQSLHARDPEHYPDGNHKLELAIALGALTGLVGFKPFSDIQQTLERYPELASFIGREAVCELRMTPERSSPVERRNLVQSMVSTLLKRSTTYEQELAKSIAQLENRLNESAASLTEAERVFLELRRKYTGADVGLFSVFLLNLVHLEQGQAVFVGAGIPHAYLEGDIVECMTNSDNVVRAGLTPKFRDVETLVQILSYETGLASILAGHSDQRRTVYPTPTPEFQVSRWHLEAGEEEYGVTEGKPEVWLITKGDIRITWGCQSGLTRTCQEAFGQGQSLLIPGLLEEFSIRPESPTELFRVTVPLVANRS